MSLTDSSIKAPIKAPIKPPIKLPIPLGLETLYHYDLVGRSQVVSMTSIGFEWPKECTAFKVTLVYPNGSWVMQWDRTTQTFQYVKLRECLTFSPDGLIIRAQGLPISSNHMGSPFKLRIQSGRYLFETSLFYVACKCISTRMGKHRNLRTRPPMIHEYEATPDPDPTIYVGEKRARPVEHRSARASAETAKKRLLAFSE